MKKPEGDPDPLVDYKDEQAFKTWDEVGALNLNRLLDDKIIHITYDDETKKPNPL